MAYKDPKERRKYLKAYQQRPDVRARRLRLQKARRKDPRVQTVQRAGDLKRRYGITLTEYDKLFAAQGYKCAVCFGANFCASDWHVDHDHATGKVRGILCRHCNRALGAVKDSIIVLKNAIKYLRRAH